MNMTRFLSPTAVATLVAAVLVGCSSDDAAICSSTDDLQASVQNLKDVRVGENGLSTISSDLTAIKGDLAQVKADAKTQYGSQLDKVDAAATALNTSVQAAKSDPSLSTLEVVTTGVKGLVADVDALASSISSTC
jgi:hypothetical protein